jgi:hypothetical protein
MLPKYQSQAAINSLFPCNSYTTRHTSTLPAIITLISLSTDSIRRETICFFIILSGVRLSPLGTTAITGLLYQPQMIDDGDCGATGGMKTGRGNRSTRRTPAQMPLCPPQIPHDQTRALTRAAAGGSQRLTA